MRLGKEAHALEIGQQCCAGLNFGYFYTNSPIIAYDGDTHPSYTMTEFTPSTVPGCRAPHLLLVLEELKLLRFHKVDAPEARGYLIDGRPPHATAVLTEKTSGVRWAVDSWTRGYGQAPEVMPLAVWQTLD